MYSCRVQWHLAEDPTTGKKIVRISTQILMTAEKWEWFSLFHPSHIMKFHQLLTLRREAQMAFIKQTYNSIQRWIVDVRILQSLPACEQRVHTQIRTPAEPLAVSTIPSTTFFARLPTMAGTGTTHLLLSYVGIGWADHIDEYQLGKRSYVTFCQRHVRSLDCTEIITITYLCRVNRRRRRWFTIPSSLGSDWKGATWLSRNVCQFVFTRNCTFSTVFLRS